MIGDVIMYFVNPPCMKQNCSQPCNQKKSGYPYDTSPFKNSMPPMDSPYNQSPNMNNSYNQFSDMNNTFNQYPDMNNPYDPYLDMNNPYNQYQNMNEQYPLNYQMPQGAQMPVFSAEPSIPPSSNGGMSMPMPFPPDVSTPPETLTDIYFTPGFLRTQIGKTMRVEFLMGTNAPLVDRIGKLTKVGASYILIEPVESNDLIMCDIYSIKFVTILTP